MAVTGNRRLTLPDGMLLALTVVVVLLAVIDGLRLYDATLYGVLKMTHFHLSRYGMVVAVVMLAIAVYIGIVKHGDVTPWFRRGTYIVFGTMLLQGLIGAVLLWVIGTKPAEDVHLIYGMGSMLALPFFIFVETTARKRPAMGSYIWGFALLLGVMFRAISTGAH